MKSCSFPAIKATPAARFGYMPPGAGFIQRKNSRSGTSAVSNQVGLSDVLLAKVLKLYEAMDRSGVGAITRADAREHFKKFGQVSATAMFNEVDDDGNNEITLEEFVDFWQQVKRSGYDEMDLDFELGELIKGNVWVDYKDDREVGHGHS